MLNKDLIKKMERKRTMNKRLKGFSLAELLISLLVISIVLSAAIPTLTKKSSASKEAIWRWTNNQNSTYFGTSYNQSVIIGAEAIPYLDQPNTHLSTILGIAETGDSIDIKNARFSNLGDKLVILKKTFRDGKGTSDLINSHISFYTINDSSTTTTNSIHYAGRLSMDAHNIALGKGTLLKLEGQGNNTAIGHFALLGNTSGIRNVGLGERTLSHNKTGSFNTALGYNALFNLGNGFDQATSNNTAIGAEALMRNTRGNHNTAVGAASLNFNANGQSNTAIGYNALSGANTDGSRNVAIGEFACSGLINGNNNICIGNRSGLARYNGSTSTTYNDNYALFIGSSYRNPETNTIDTTDEEPLIYGHTQYTGASGAPDKEIYFNIRRFGVRSFDGSYDAYTVDAQKGNGYDRTGGLTSTHSFNLRQTGSESTSLAFRGDNDFVTIASYNKNAPQTKENTKDISFNQILHFKFPKNLSYRDVEINTLANSNNQLYTLKLNSKLLIDGESGDQDPLLQLSSTNGFFVSSKNNTSNIGIQTTGINIVGPNITLKATNGFRLLDGSGNQKIGFTSGGDITLAALSGDQSIKNNFTNIWSEIAGLKNMAQTAFNLISDERLKNISGENTAGLKEINALKVKNFTFKNDKTKAPQVGVIAQELQKVFPNSVMKGEDGYFRIKTDEIFYAMVNAIKELGAQIQSITVKISGLDKRLTELEKQNKKLVEKHQEFENRLSKLEKKVK